MTSKSLSNNLNILPPNISPLKHQIHVLGLSTLLIIKSYIAILGFKVKRKEVLKQMVAIGFNTLPMVLLMTAFSGMVLALETADWLQRYGGREGVGALVCGSSVVEIAPIFVSFAIASQAGTAITAELAHMQITEQISALRLSKVNPINYLVATRIAAAIYCLPLAVITGAFFSILGGMIVAYLQTGIETSIYIESVWRVLRFKEIFNAIIKAFFFANYIIAVHTAFGLTTRGGAKDIGKMTSISTIWVTVGIVVINAVLDLIMYLD